MRAPALLLCATLTGLLAGCGAASLPGSEAPATATVRASSIKDSEAVWFGPNVGSTDMLRLFAQPGEWPNARDKVGVLQFYVQQLAATSPAACPSCGDNILPNFRAQDAFRKLAGWGIGIAIEAGAVKHHTCDGEVAAAAVAGVITSVQAEGGSVRYVAMDEPYIGGEQRVGSETCGYTMTRSALETARFIRKLGTLHPGVRVGDIEPYPAFRLAQLQGWVDELLRNGVTPAFFHLDVDRVAVKNVRANVNADLRALKSFLDARGIPLGVIFWGHELDIPRGSTTPDRAYYDAVLGWVGTVSSAIGAPAHAIFQSWLRGGDGRHTIPNNLSETAYSHTRLINDGWARFSPSPGGESERVATIKVQHAYLGILGRAADPSGLASYVAAVRGGLRIVDLCRSLFDSAEYRTGRGTLTPEQLAESLYLGILERASDPSGLTNAVSQIRAGRRAELAAGMLDSPEFATRFLASP
jgi:hypothetical protein